MKHNFLILGGGMQGTAAAYDIAKFGDPGRITVADISKKLASASAARVNRLTGREVAVPVSVDASKPLELSAVLKGHDACLSAVPYFLNAAVTKACIDAGVHMNDLGGNTDVVMEQHAMGPAAKKKGVSIVPDTGLMPGFGNTLASVAMNEMDSPRSVQVRCGGLPQKPKPPLGYKLVFSMEGLINEYLGQAHVIKDGSRTTVDCFTEVEEIEFPEPVGRCEAFVTTGGASTFPWTFEGKINEYSYKTVRYPGHYAAMKTMIDLGLLDSRPIRVEGVEVVPRKLFARVVTPRISFPRDRDLIVLRSTVTGTHMGKHAEITYELLDLHCVETGFTAMERCTAYPAAIITIMMARGLTKPGALRLERDIDNKAFMSEFSRRDFRLVRKSSVELPAG